MFLGGPYFLGSLCARRSPLPSGGLKQMVVTDGDEPHGKNIKDYPKNKSKYICMSTHTNISKQKLPGIVVAARPFFKGDLYLNETRKNKGQIHTYTTNPAWCICLDFYSILTEIYAVLSHTSAWCCEFSDGNLWAFSR